MYRQVGARGFLLCLLLLVGLGGIYSPWSKAQSDEKVRLVAAALDVNQSGILEDVEINQAIQLWILAQSVPGTDMTISDAVMPRLIQLWVVGAIIERPPVPTPTPAPPSGAIPDGPGNFFVHMVGNDDNTGSKDAAFATINKGIEAALALGGGQVYVGGGTYLGRVGLRSRVKVYGGFNPETWVRDPDNFPSTIDAPPPAVLADSVVLATIEGFTIQASNGISTPEGNSVVVALQAGVGITIKGNTIIAADGRKGLSKRTGVDGRSGASGGHGEPADFCPPKNEGGTGGTRGGLASGGRGGAGGAFSGDDGSAGAKSANVPGGQGGTGGSTANRGSRGHDGKLGQPGRPGVGGGAFGSLVDGQYVPADGTPGSDGGGGSGGGGGGGAGGIIVFVCGGGGGGGGSGGDGGQGGGGGTSGGASIGILVVNNSDVEIINNHIITGAGGQGGDGSAGGTGGKGGKGGKGGQEGSGKGTGGEGGAGGRGGDGGPGGGGGGGPSIGILEDDTSLSVHIGNQFTLGTPGEAGSAVLTELVGANGMQQDYFKWSAP